MPTVKDQRFNNWDDALRHANRLFDKGQISRDEIDKIARSAYAAKIVTGNARKMLDRLKRG